MSLPGNRLIVAVDVENAEQALALADRVADQVACFKIGLELFVAEGPALVRKFVDAGRPVMLDLKLHDIPQTVARATARAADLGVSLLTIHSGGGRAMMQAAAEVARGSGSGGSRMRTLAVTVLTSMDNADLAEVGAREGTEALVLRRAQLAMEAGCDGVVASPREAASLRAGAPDDFLIVTPGVRPAGTDAGDQKRIATPKQARSDGADMIVVGRPIRDAADPAAAARDIAAELAS